MADLPAQLDSLHHAYKIQDDPNNAYNMYPFQSFVNMVNSNMEFLKSKITVNGKEQTNYPIGFFDSSLARKYGTDIDNFNKYINTKQVVMDFALSIALKDAKLPVYCVDTKYFVNQYNTIKNLNPSSEDYKTKLLSIAAELKKTLEWVAETNIATAIAHKIPLETKETQDYYNKNMKANVNNYYRTPTK